jgi:hypothetical protein
MAFTQYPPVNTGTVGAVTSTTPITGNPASLDTLGKMALAIQTNASGISVLSSQVATLSTIVSTFPPVNELMLKTEYDTDANLIVDTADVINGGFI